MSAEDRFRAAVNVIRNLPSKGSFQPSTDLQLKFYSYFKQATEGPCLVAKPSFWDVVGKAKWDAWKNLGNMPKEEAMENYVEELKQIVETMSYTESVSRFMDLLGPFYEAVPITKSNSQPMLNGDKDIESNGGVVAKANGFGDQVESDGEEFSDTYDHIREARGGAEQNVIVPSRTSVGDIGTAAGGGIPTNRGARSRNPREGPQAPSGGDLSRLLGGAGGNGPPSGGGNLNSQDVNAQLALVVIKLQNSLDEVNARLLALENALPNSKSRGASNVVQKIFGISPNLLVLILLWPFVAAFLMKAAQRRHQSM